MDKLIVTSLDAVPGWARDCVLTIGNFDGVHLGHQRILLNCRSLAAQENLPVVVITFDPLPEAILYPLQPAPRLIVPSRQNCLLLLRGGANLVAVVTTTPELLATEAHEFLEEVIFTHFVPRHIVEGTNFFFGRGRAGSVVTLENVGARKGCSVTIVEPVVVRLGDTQRRVSSTLIRELIADGKIDDANFCLGRPFALCGRVVKGEGRGRTLEFPTANLQSQGQVIPGDGVYAGKARIGERGYFAAISVGRKTTFGRGIDRAVEAHLLDADGDFAGQDMALTFIKHLREQRTFSNPKELAAQIARDVEEVRQLLAQREAKD